MNASPHVLETMVPVRAGVEATDPAPGVLVCLDPAAGEARVSTDISSVDVQPGTLADERDASARQRLRRQLLCDRGVVVDEVLSRPAQTDAPSKNSLTARQDNALPVASKAQWREQRHRSPAARSERSHVGASASSRTAQSSSSAGLGSSVGSDRIAVRWRQIAL